VASGRGSLAADAVFGVKGLTGSDILMLASLYRSSGLPAIVQNN
jgi:hypothetical protein